MTVTRETKDNALILWIDNPPVNALSQDVRAAILAGVTEAQNDASVKGIVIACKGRTFIAGADVKEFGAPPTEPFLPDVTAAIENSKKTVVAAIHGQALGGGLEIALACHYRIAAKGAKLGLPEVTLGLVPGAGGTQRLPRLIESTAAAEMIASGKPIDANKAKANGLVDSVAEDYVAEAIAFATTKSAENRRLSERAFQLDAAKFDALAAATRKQAKGAAAPGAAIDLIRRTAGKSFAEGMKEERALFLHLRASEEAKALRHIFFAERGSNKLPDDISDAKPIEVKTVGIIGAGTMGTGIAMTYLDAGMNVRMLEMAEDAVARGLARIQSSYRDSLAKGRITEAQRDQRLAALTGGTDYAALSDCDLIIEAVFESMDVKKAVFAKLDGVAKPGAILATNTSYLDIDEIAASISRPEAVVGLHYFSPANIMKLLEIVRAKKTSPQALATALSVAKATNKIPVVAGVCPGFIGNRMLRAYVREAGLLLLEGAAPEQVDKALTAFGMAMGPFAVADLSGIDIGYKARKEAAPGSFEPMATIVHDSLVEAGHLGQKSGSGFYTYKDGVKAPNPVALTFIEQVRSETGRTPRAVSDAEIVERTMFALVNEGYWIVEEGIARHIDDIDVAYVNGYGFPRHRGGPMCYARGVGLSKVVKVIEGFGQGAFGKWWRIAPALRNAAAAN
ncbi:MAG: enoyl-CoA hydratase/isomerase family protein [Rhodospirillaceae bacterium]|nr:enoyl-CoA hydratase/isomerase family protein [Rhodospirillaceae bacterium]